MRKEISNWIEQAKADLRSAKNCINVGDLYLGIFACHQSVEKVLKALCLIKFKEAPQTHSIIYLAQKLNVPKVLMSGIKRLNPEYLITRYPDIAGEVPDKIYDKKVALEHIKTTEEVMKWSEQQIKR